MIAHLRGRLFAKHPNQAIVEAGGVGYDVTISVPTFSALPAEGAEVSLVIHTHVREDQIALFGFTNLIEKKLFEKLISVSGIGPKLAITVLSGLPAEKLVGAIRSSDHAMLTRIPGIGKKTAERVVLELKDKLDEIGSGPAGASIGAVGDDVLSAMVNLGYQRPVAQKAIETARERVADANDFDELFRAAIAAVR
ncbi:MAG: Holliday junction branch migration protein RuvA [Acidobacteriaceae bacterium]|jgi:Holliday junction DNA helicase RuvA|nr:Holliday junction branch migration protein RuvA [Acidobacteriaceae bacterium]